VANHPLGGLDGLALLAWVLSRHGDARVAVNAILTAIPHLRGYAVGVRRGQVRRSLATDFETALRSNAPLIVFPAGATSRRWRSSVLDPAWSPAFVRLARRYQRPIIVVHISGRNSRRFYAVSEVRRALSIPWNLEMLLLPREFLNPTTRQLRLRLLPALTAADLAALGATERHRAQALRERCYAAAQGGAS
jgi:putative hemolysin